MKKILFKFFILLLLPIVFYILASGFYKGSESSANSNVVIPPSPGDKDFMNCIFNGGIYPGNADWIENQLDLDKYSGSLHFNAVHLYDVINGTSSGTSTYGTFADSLEPGQISNVNRLLSKTSGLGFLYDRCKISQLCYAQRLIYEIKDPTNGDLVNNGFCYQNNYGGYTTDQGRTVLHLVPNTHTENDIATGIYENLQHGDLYGFNLQFADDGTWYVKPMMKIPTGIQGDKEVVRIDIINFSGTTIKSVTIKAENFGSNYGGNYIDEFVFPGDNPLKVVGDHTDAVNGLNYGQIDEYWGNWETNCQVDFKVHWLGDVEVWFDKMTVDDEFGNELFAGNYNDKILNEIAASSNNGWNFINFQDEVTYSQIEAIKYVKDFIAVHYPPIKLHFASSNYHSVRGFRNDLLGHSIMLDRIQPYEINVDAHEFSGLLPYQFINDSRFPDHWKSTSDADYNAQLQGRSFGDRNSRSTEDEWFNYGTRYMPPPHGTLIYQIELARQQIHDYSSSTKFIMQPQIHGFLYYSVRLGKFLWGVREPTNEEIQAQAMIAIAHGADGICWFIYNSAKWETGTHTELIRPLYYGNEEIEEDRNPSDLLYQLGLLNGADDYYTERHSNLYGQDKWVYVAAMNQKIEEWKPTLDAITWQSGYSVHSEGSNHEYIQRILSVDPRIQGANPCVEDSPYGIWADCADETYWEMGFFTPLQEPPDVSKYFMMVNRRCVPIHGDNEGDIRALRIRFKSEQLLYYNTWQISDITKPDEVHTFLKSYQGPGGYVFLGDEPGSAGYFEPGEGKLFKLEPVS